MTRLLLLCLIYAQAIRHRVDPQTVVAMCYVESSFRPGVVNKGCYGLMQVSLATWKSKLQLDPARMLEVNYNLDKGLDILCIYIKQTGSMEHALEHYNCGPSGKYKSNYVQKVKSAYKSIYGVECGKR